MPIERLNLKKKSSLRWHIVGGCLCGAVEFIIFTFYTHIGQVVSLGIMLFHTKMFVG
jgi:hypothetical protein